MTVDDRISKLSARERYAVSHFRSLDLAMLTLVIDRAELRDAGAGRERERLSQEVARRFYPAGAAA